MSKLRDVWDAYIYHAADWQDVEAAITEAEETIARLTRERDEARAKLFPYADATEISGFSWNGLYIIGDEASVKAVKAAIHQAGQIEEYRAAFKQREEALKRERDEAREKALDEAARAVSQMWTHYSPPRLREVTDAILALKGDKP